MTRRGSPLDETLTLLRNPPGTHRLPTDPAAAVTAFAPPSEDLVALSARVEAMDTAAASSRGEADQAYSALPPDAPDWMRAARVLSDALEKCIARGNVDYFEQSAIERAWFAWTLGGATPRHVLRVAHLVRRAHEALRQSSRAAQETTIRGCAEVIQNNLPAPVRQAIPLERTVWVVRQLREQPDPWVAIVEGTAELLGWKDYARVHAANLISAVVRQY